MENNTTDPIQKLIKGWQSLTLTKKVSLVGFLVVLSFFVYLVLMNLMTSSTGLNGQSYDNYSYPPNIGLGKTILPQPNPSQPTEKSYTSGADAEQFEARDYLATIETSRLTESCQKIEAMRPRPEVIFLSTTNYRTNCHYSFKVENSQTESVLSVLKDLKPKELQQNISTLKKQIENSLNQRDILDKNLLATEEILSEALVAYDNLLSLATTEGDATALATAVREKISLIDQLKQRREQTRQAIDYLNQHLVEQQDRLLYTYFNVSITERKFFNGYSIGESWKYEFEKFVTLANTLLQQLSLGLVSFILHVILYSLYVIIFLVIVKLGYRLLRKIWQI